VLIEHHNAWQPGQAQNPREAHHSARPHHSPEGGQVLWVLKPATIRRDSTRRYRPLVLGFEEMTDPERAVWEADETGDVVDLGVGDPERDNPAMGADWGASRQVRAQLLCELLTGVNGPKDVRPRALQLAGARITGTLDLEAATLVRPLNLRRCSFDQPINLQEAQAPAVRLPGSRAPGLKGDQIQTRSNLELNEGFAAEGEVSLIGAHIGGQLSLDGATLINPGGDALKADKLTVGQSMFCRGFTAQGEVRLLVAHIGGQLSFDGATLINPSGIALDLEGVRTPTLVLRPHLQPQGMVDLTNAQVDSVVDSQATWPQDLDLNGFRYGDLIARPEVGAKARLRWLERNPGGYSPQLYEQLAAAYRRAGRDDDARKVAIKKQRRRRQTLNPLGKAWNSLLDSTVGYGYQTWKAGVWLLVLIGLGWWIFDRAYPAHLVAAKLPGQRPSFHAGLYALDVLLPFTDLGYQSAWIAGAWARWFYLGWNLAGWVLITAVVAAVSGLIKRD
jgi:hypothetical protein